MQRFWQNHIQPAVWGLTFSRCAMPLISGCSVSSSSSCRARSSLCIAACTRGQPSPLRRGFEFDAQ